VIFSRRNASKPSPWIFRSGSSASLLATSLQNRSSLVFVLLLRHIDRIRQASAVRAWLATTTVRLTRRRLRMKRLRMLLGLSDDTGLAEARDSGSSPEDRAAFRAVHVALESVGVNARIAWTLRYLEQERIEDVARLCGCSKRTAKRRIASAQRAVKGALGHD